VVIWERGEARGSHPSVKTAILLSFSLAAKQVTTFHPLLWLRRRRGWAIVAGAYLATAAFLLPYADRWRPMLKLFLDYTSVPRSYGFSEWVVFDSRWGPIVGAVDAAAGLLAAWFLSRKPLPQACLLLFLVLLFFAPGLGSQYLIWPLAFGALRPRTGYWLFTAASTLWILGSLFGVVGSGGGMGHLIWLSVAFWAIREIRELRAGSAPVVMTSGVP
jgi:hypothetical protein